MTAVSPLTKAARQAQIADILARSQVRSQEELAELLAQRDVRVTQATLSRDLDELGAVRLRSAGGGLVYALPGDPGGPGSRPGGVPAAPGGVPAARDEGPAAPGGVPAGPGGVPAGPGETGRANGPNGPAATPAGVRGGLGSRGAGGRKRLFVEVGAEHPDRLARVGADLLLSAEASANLVVLRTPAGGAQLLASAIDHAGWPSILGTVAGDDTVLVITREAAGGDEVAETLLRLAERRG